jgi:DNA polymerase elongation subunit (family B)
MTDQDRNYVAAWVDYDADKIIVLERDKQGSLFRKRYNPPYYFYVPAEEGEKGDYTSIFGDSLVRAEFDSREAFEYAKRHFPVKFESDIPPLKRVLMDYYYDRPTPIVNTAFLDIEVDYSRKIGFAGPTNPYAVINAVTVYQSWSKKYLTAVIPPKGWKGTKKDLYDKMDMLISEKLLREERIPEITICSDELELLTLMLKWVGDADILSGWNSEFYDIPYICERLLLAGGERMLAKLDHLGVRLPKKEMVSRFGTEEPVYRFTGRTHLDYMRLFKKFTFEGRTSYSLGNILEEEVGVGKLEYDGTLEELYNNDFATFTAYNFRDVDGLVQLDDKFNFMALANQMAHENTVMFDAVLGTVSYVETGITNHAHNKLGLIVHDKNIKEHDKVEGAIVMTPWIGMHDWVAAVDIKSLYPNTIRSLNMSPEMIVGQFANGEKAWADIREGNQNRHVLMFDNGSQEVTTAAEWKELLLASKWAVSAYGTVFNQSGPRGVVADILGFWYAERKRLQGEKKKYAKLGKDEKDPVKKAEYKVLEDHYDLLQLTKKISMNSLYGALLNVAFRFGDERMGASVTASGRGITTHMIESMAEKLTGIRTPLVKTTTTDEEGKPVHNYTSASEAIIYGDTDSCYYKCIGATDKESAIKIADEAAEAVNASFPEFMREAFLCQPGFDTFIEAGREIVGVRGLFQAKKKYMIKVVDLEGFAVDKMKSQGSEIKKADTPKIIQKFLKSTVDMILDGVDYDTVATFVNEQRREILKKKINLFSLGVAKQVNNLDKYTAEYLRPGTIRNESGNKLTIPGHARASCNYNFLLDHFEKGAKTIRSGDKVLIYHLKPNQFKFLTIAFPSEMVRFPKWFEENFAVDVKKTEDSMFDSKLSGIFSALGKDVPSPQSVLTNSILEF